MPLKICQDCRFSHNRITCEHPASMLDPDFATGEARYHSVGWQRSKIDLLDRISELFSKEKKCGPDGKFFEPIPPISNALGATQEDYRQAKLSLKIQTFLMEKSGFNVTDAKNCAKEIIEMVEQNDHA